MTFYKRSLLFDPAPTVDLMTQGQNMFNSGKSLPKICCHILAQLIKPLQNKKGTREKSSLFPYKRTAFFLGTPNFLGPSYFEAALVKNEHQLLKCNCTRMPDTFFSKRTFVQWLSKIHFIQFTTQENLQFTWEPLPTRECVWDTGISKEMVGQVLLDENNQAPTTTPLIGIKVEIILEQR